MRSFLAAVVLAVTSSAASAQWTLQNSNTTASLRGIHSLGDGVAWASGTSGTVLRTTDGGATWEKCAVPPKAEKLDFRAVQGFNAKAAMVMSSGTGQDSRIYKTNDGCKTWALIYWNHDAEGFWDAFRLGPDQGSGKDTTEGLLLGDPVKGHFSLWEVNADEVNFAVSPVEPRPDSKKQEAAFAASNSSIFIEWTFGTFWIGTGGKDGARVIRRVVKQSGPFTRYVYPAAKVPMAHGSDSAGIFGLAFRPEQKVPGKSLKFAVGVAVGGDYQQPNEAAGTAAYTFDAGKTWQAAQTPPNGYRSAVAYDAARQAWITVGPSGTDVSTDDGANWSAVKSADGSDKGWNALSLPFVVGEKGRIGRLDADALKHATPNAAAAQTPASNAKSSKAASPKKKRKFGIFLQQ